MDDRSKKQPGNTRKRDARAGAPQQKSAK
jgi:hypothetical protein